MALAAARRANVSVYLCPLIDLIVFSDLKNACITITLYNQL